MNQRSLMLLWLIMLTSLQTALADSVPPLINYQGTLTDATGHPITNGSKKLSFNIYDAATDGTLIWGPQVFNTVPVINGLFNVILGTTDTGGRLIADAFGSENRFLGVTVDDGTEITPRQQVLSAPFAVQAKKADDSTLLNGQSSRWHIPVGTVVFFWGETAPDGWLLCNGSAIPTAYEELIAIVGSNTPDLRGVFLRGLDAGRGLDTGRVFGSYQLDRANALVQVEGGVNAMPPTGVVTVPDNGSWSAWAFVGTAGPGDANFRLRKQGGETYPKNIAINYIIKY
ncbi:MAG: phage tail protein [Pseudomonadota bacterium]